MACSMKNDLLSLTVMTANKYNTYAILLVFCCKTIINTILHLIKDIFRSKNKTYIAMFKFSFQNSYIKKVLIYSPNTPIILNIRSCIIALTLKDNILNISNIGTFPN